MPTRRAGRPDGPVVRVLPDVSGLDKVFDYLVPESLRDQVRVGTMVRIELHGRRVGGWVVALVEPEASLVAPERLKPIAKVTGHGPSAEVLDLARWAAHRWAGPLRAVLRSASPPVAVKRLPPSARSADGRARSATTDPLLPPGRVVRVPPAGSVLPILDTALAQGPTLVIVPSADRAALAAARLRRSGWRVAELPGEWAAAAAGVDLVVGARAAVWASVPGIAAIVVLDEHDEGLQEERSPTWNARDVAQERARRLGVPCVLVSPVPSLAALASGLPLHPPSRIEERVGWPLVDVVDLDADDPWVTSLATSPLIAELRAMDRRVVCVHNTTGRARRLACKACREMAVCEACATPVAELEPGVLRCPRCTLERPKLCQACGSGRLVMLRPGVSRLREELEAAAGRAVVEITAANGEERAGVDVYIGTEAVLHRVRRADTVAFLDLDGELLAPRYRAGEHVLALAARAARLVGGRERGGKLLLQTYLPHHEVVDAIRHADPARATASLEHTRRALGYPPFGALASVAGVGADEFAAEVRALTAITVLGPTDGHYLVRADSPDALASALAAVPRPLGSRLRIHVDPPRL